MIHETAQIHPTAVVDEPCEIGAETRVWHFSHVRTATRIGHHCSFGMGSYVGSGVEIGNGCRIQNHVSIYESVSLEDEVFCGPSCVFTNVINPRAAIDRKEEFLPTRIRRGATIGANATIICGITVGRWALIGAGAIVRRDIPDFALVVGVPTKRIGWVGIRGETLPNLVVGQTHTCPVEGHQYFLESVNCLRLLTPEPAPRHVYP
ncbi:MAG: N-acetyltransferase [Candidatus Sumerlaeia bacterium]|nr:N-acetyltransferase [Candidatus Sumerlaeia bacterium]